MSTEQENRTRLDALTKQLRERLLRIGGTTVRQIEQPDATNMIASLLKHGRVISAPIQVIAGKKSDECHGNTLALFLLTDGKIEVHTGYALAPDDHPNAGVWSEHTWAVHEGKIIETTPLKRKKYFGCPHPNPEPWAAYELRTKGMWRDDVLDYLKIFRPESGDALLNLIHAEPKE